MNVRDQVRGWTTPETFDLLDRYVDVRQARWRQNFGVEFESRERFWRWVLERIEFIDQKALVVPHRIEEFAARFSAHVGSPGGDSLFMQAFERLWRESLVRTRQIDRVHKAPPVYDDGGQVLMF